MNETTREPTQTVVFLTETLLKGIETVISNTTEEIINNVTETVTLKPTQTNSVNNTIDVSEHPNVKRAGHLNNLTMPFLLYFSSGLLLFLGFCFLRNKFKIFYMPRRRLKRCAPPRIPSGFFSWIMVVLRLKTSYVLPIVGVDAEVFLLFLKMSMKLFLTIGLLALIILLPVNYSGHANKIGYKQLANTTKLLQDGDEKTLDVLILEQITIDNIHEQSPLLSFHIAFSWIFSLIAYIFLFKYYNRCREIRMKYIQNCYNNNNNYKQLINFRSIMLFGLPKEYRNEEALYNFFSELGIGDLEKVVICRRYLHLRKALENRQYYLTKIEDYYTNWIGYDFEKGKKKKKERDSPQDDEAERIYQKMQSLILNNNFKKMKEERSNSENSLLGTGYSSSHNLTSNQLEPRYDKILLEDQTYTKERSKGRLYIFGSKIDLLNYYVEKFIKWDNNVKKLRRKTNNHTTPVAFVTFRSPLSALIGAQCLLYEKPFTCFVSLATEPRDIYWKNISNRFANPYTKLIRAIFVVVISGVIVIIWFIPITFIFTVMNVKNFIQIIPKLSVITHYLNSFMIDLIDSALSMIVLATWLSFLPDILTLLSEIQGIETYSWLEKALLNKYYFYQIFNVLFIFSIGNVLLEFVRYFAVTTGIESLWTYINNKPTELLKKFASSLTNMSPFYINYIMLQAFLILSIQLIYPAPIAKSLITWILKFIGIRKTPRIYSNLSDPRVFSLNYGYISTLPLVLFTVTMTFSCICPIIPLLGTIYFSYSLLIYKYQLMYIQHPRYESYGGLVPSYIKRCVFAIFIFQVTMFGVLSIKLSVENDSDDSSSPNLWGFKTILYMVPLLLCTFVVYWWFKQSFEKHFKYIPLEVVSKRFNYDKCIVNSKTTLTGKSSTSSNDYAYTYCSYCGSHDVITSKTPINKQRSNSSSSIKDISSQLRKRSSLERESSNTDLFTSTNINNNNSNKSHNIISNNRINKNNPNYIPYLKYDNDQSLSDLQELNAKIDARNKLNNNSQNYISNNNNNNNILNYKQNQTKTKSPLSKGKQKNTMVYIDELTSEGSETMTPVNQNSSLSTLEPNSSNTNLTQEIIKLNTNYKNLNISTSPQLTPNTTSLMESTRLFITTQGDDDNNVIDSPRREKPRHTRNISQNNPLVRDKYSSRRWIFDEYTDYQQPRSLRVDGISDIPWDVYQLNGGYLNINDEQLYSYEHPAIVGPLPSLWLPNKMNTGVTKGEELLEALIKEYKRVHYNELNDFENEDEDFNDAHIAEEIECDNDHPEWMNKISRKVYKYKRKFEDLYTRSLQRYIDYIVQWLNFGLR